MKTIALLAVFAAAACHGEPAPSPAPLPPPIPRRVDVQVGSPTIEPATTLDEPQPELSEPTEKYKGCMVYCPAEAPRIDRGMPLKQCIEDEPACDQDPIWETRSR